MRRRGFTWTWSPPKKQKKNENNIKKKKNYIYLNNGFTNWKKKKKGVRVRNIWIKVMVATAASIHRRAAHSIAIASATTLLWSTSPIRWGASSSSLTLLMCLLTVSSPSLLLLLLSLVFLSFLHPDLLLFTYQFNSAWGHTNIWFSERILESLYFAT